MNDLNIDNAICSLIVKALNKHTTKIGAIKELGISDKMLYGRMKKHNIIKIENKYESKSNTPT